MPSRVIVALCGTFSSCSPPVADEIFSDRLSLSIFFTTPESSWLALAVVPLGLDDAWLVEVWLEGVCVWPIEDDGLCVCDGWLVIDGAAQCKLTRLDLSAAGATSSPPCPPSGSGYPVGRAPKDSGPGTQPDCGVVFHATGYGMPIDASLTWRIATTVAGIRLNDITVRGARDVDVAEIQNLNG